MSRIPGFLCVLVVVLGPSDVPAQSAPPPAQPSVRPGSPSPGGQLPGLPPRDQNQGARAAPTGTGKIRGRVVSSQSSQPLRRAQIRLFAADPGQQVGRATTSDADGRFEMTELPAGRFIVSAMKAGYVTLQYGQRRAFESGTPVTLAEGQTLERIDFALPQGSVIAVRVTDEFGEPVAGAQVQIQRYQYGPDGQRRLTTASSGILGLTGTDDRGEFRAFGLMPGEYIVMASVRSTFLPPAGAAANSSDTSEGFAATYYPGTTSVGEAQAVSVGIGQETAIQLALVASRMSRVSGRVVDSQGRPAAGAALSVVTASGGGFSSFPAGQVSADGSFSVSGISPGEHTLRVQMTRPGSSGESGAATLVVGALDLTGVEVMLSAGARVTGRVIFDGTPPTADGPTPLRVTAIRADPQPNMFLGGTTDPQANGTVDAEGNFALGGVTGRVFLNVPPPPGWTIRSITVGNDDITDTPLDMSGVQSLSDVRFVLTDKLTTVAGLVVDQQGQPMKDYVVVVQPLEAKEALVAARLIRVMRPDTSGRFQLRGMRPGRYVATAIESLEQGRQFAPEFQEQLRRGAREFSLDEGETVTLDLRLTPGL